MHNFLILHLDICCIMKHFSVIFGCNWCIFIIWYYRFNIFYYFCLCSFSVFFLPVFITFLDFLHFLTFFFFTFYSSSSFTVFPFSYSFDFCILFSHYHSDSFPQLNPLLSFFLSFFLLVCLHIHMHILSFFLCFVFLFTYE